VGVVFTDVCWYMLFVGRDVTVLFYGSTEDIAASVPYRLCGEVGILRKREG